MNVTIDRDILRALDLVSTLESKEDLLFVGAKVEITIRNKGTFYGIVDTIGGAILTLARPIPIDCEEEELYEDMSCMSFDIDDVIQVFSY